MPDYRTNKAWQHAHKLALKIYKYTKPGFPSSERFGRVPQMRRAVVAIPATIAEGSGRSSQKEYHRVLYVAKSSPNELEYHSVNQGAQFHAGCGTPYCSRKYPSGCWENTRCIYYEPKAENLIKK